MTRDATLALALNWATAAGEHYKLGGDKAAGQIAATLALTYATIAQGMPKKGTYCNVPEHQSTYERVPFEDLHDGGGS